jgi:uncharacterized Zn finger protein
MIVCPYCQQDYVWEVTIRDLPGPLYMCLECDTVWEAAQDIHDGKGQNFEDFMIQRGQVADWKAITKVRQPTEP